MAGNPLTDLHFGGVTEENGRPLKIPDPAGFSDLIEIANEIEVLGARCAGSFCSAPGRGVARG
jgi:hypothetical protein